MSVALLKVNLIRHFYAKNGTDYVTGKLCMSIISCNTTEVQNEGVALALHFEVLKSGYTSGYIRR